jgi:hypothetical protein
VPRKGWESSIAAAKRECRPESKEFCQFFSIFAAYCFFIFSKKQQPSKVPSGTKKLDQISRS